ncbi:UTP23-like protein [Mitosporidium daphniae]|uniref:UTP23-like protein n=1 Tax=Mitosporidium daphniae TaxID=1485682 RepID=A0A098VSU4_9MICR|nr:UTP23-like protein [Mitosporidium daphniae]KGG52050.1 UTP23-like protein [Mitosporidium daphniae]|eukprot:XP_013238477.1 UTP23-like protein [Mitosporidium daphniae]
MLPALCPRSIAFGSKSVACGNVFIVLGSANKHKYVVCSQDTAFLQELSTLGGVPTIHIYKGVLQLDPISSASKALKEEKEAQKDKLTKAERREIATLINQPDPTDVPQKRGPNPLSVKKRKALVGRNSEALPTAEQQRPIRKRKRKPSTKEDV